MLVKAEVFVKVDSKDEGDAQWETLMALASKLDGLYGLKKIRLPDSPEPDISGCLEFKGTGKLSV